MKTITVLQFSTPAKVSFRNGRKAQSTGSILFSTWTKCLSAVAGSPSARHPQDWPERTQAARELRCSWTGPEGDAWIDAGHTKD